MPETHNNRLLHINDSFGSYPNSYYAATANLTVECTSLQGQTDADVCIVGGGYTGLSAGLHLAQRGYKVVILEAHRVGWGASGRNGGQADGGQRIDQQELEALIGDDQAKLAWDVGQQAIAKVKNLIAEHNINCGFKPGIMHVNHRARYNDETQRLVEHMATKYDYHALTYLNKTELEEVLGADGYHGGALDSDAGHLHPLNLALGLAKAAQQAGVTIYERSEVTDIDETSAKPVISTADGQVTAQTVVLACNGYLGGLYAPTAARLIPINNFIIASEPLSETEAADVIRNDAAVADSRFVINYFRLSEDKRLLFGGGESYGDQFPRDISAVVRRAMKNVFPHLLPKRIDYAWGGTLAITLKRLPIFGRTGANIYTACGYSGQGVALGVLAGEVLAEAVAGDQERFDVMASLPTPRFPGGPALRRPLLVLGMIWYALRDRL